MSKEFIEWKNTDDEKPKSGRFVICRDLIINYGGDNYNFYILACNGKGEWRDYNLKQHLPPPEQWAYLHRPE